MSLMKQKWATLLGNMVSPSFPENAIEALTDMLPLFDFPDEAFCTESLKAVARAKRRQSCPSFDEIEGALIAWCQKNLPAPQLAIAGPGAAPALEPNEESWLRTFRDHEAENYARYGSFARESGAWCGSPNEAAREHCLSMMSRLAPAAAKMARAELAAAGKNAAAPEANFVRQCLDD